MHPFSVWVKDKEFFSKCNHWNVVMSPFCLLFHRVIFWYIDGIELCFIPSTFPCGSLVGTGLSFPEKAYSRRSGDCFWITDPFLSAGEVWQLWSCSLLLLVGSGCGCCWPGCSQCVMGAGYGLGFSLILLGFFFYFSFSFYFLEWLSSVCFCCLFLLSSPRSTMWYNFDAYFWKALNVSNVCCWHLSSSSNVHIYNSSVTVEFQELSLILT